MFEQIEEKLRDFQPGLFCYSNFVVFFTVGSCYTTNTKHHWSTMDWYFQWYNIQWDLLCHDFQLFCSGEFIFSIDYSTSIHSFHFFFFYISKMFQQQTKKGNILSGFVTNWIFLFNVFSLCSLCSCYVGIVI